VNKTKKILALGLSCLAILTLAACSKPTKDNTSASTKASSSVAKKDDSSTSKENKTQASSDKKEDVKSKKFAVGDKITFDNVAEYTITSVEWTDELDFDKSNSNKSVKITYDVTNLSDTDLSFGNDIELYVGGKKMEPYASNVMGFVSPNITFKLNKNFKVSGNGDFELKVKPPVESISKSAIVAFKLD